MNRLEGIRERLSKATPGPWLNDDFSVKTREDAAYGYPADDSMICGLYDGEYIENPNAKQDAIFISHAPSDIEYLLKEVERYKECLKDVHSYLSQTDQKLTLQRIEKTLYVDQ